MAAEIDLDHLKAWIGRTERVVADVSPDLQHRFNATFDAPSGTGEAGEPAPLGIHWCLAPTAAPTGALDADGHPPRGGFLPPVPLPRRMWAGGALSLLDPLRVGDRVERLSRIADVQVKAGRSGVLCFVTVDHTLETARGTAIRERQDIVYRGKGDADPAPTAAPAPAEPLAGAWAQPVRTDPVLLFRYSALTFNGHRIHYDRDHARTVEGYDDLVVHGPLQATWLVRFAARIQGRAPAHFAFRSLSPLLVGRDAVMEAEATDGGLRLWIAEDGGRRTMTATAD